uniref:Uncharacterized protein n=1 Tax=Amphimedon queenslandica TaxID=400682 RepID=A0A1X7VAM9_AMPQE
MKELFFNFLNTQAEKDKTWQFWKGFVSEKCLAYVTLFLSIRGSNWHLQKASLKSMALIFAALDRDNYQRIIPTHLADQQIMPSHILDFFSSGGFTVHITGDEWKAGGIDEAHEMCINKDIKGAVTYPTLSYIQKTSTFLNYRIKLSKNIFQQIFPKNTNTGTTPSIFSTAIEQKKQENINAMIKCIAENNLISLSFENGRGLINTFTGKEASLEQMHDMINIRLIGQTATESSITHNILGQSSITNSTIRQKRLLTMSTKKISKKGVSAKDRENNRVIKCLQRRLARCNHTGQALQSEHEQYSFLPRALADENGIPHKSPESHQTGKLQTRYRESTPCVLLM